MTFKNNLISTSLSRQLLLLVLPVPPQGGHPLNTSCGANSGSHCCMTGTLGFEHLDELLKTYISIVGAWRSLRVVLDAHCLLRRAQQTCKIAMSM